MDRHFLWRRRKRADESSGSHCLHLRCCLVAASTLGFIVFSSRVAGLVFLLIVGGVVCAPEHRMPCALIMTRYLISAAWCDRRLQFVPQLILGNALDGTSGPPDYKPHFGKDNAMFAPFCTKTITVLPRQARDKHRESTRKKRCVFLRPPRHVHVRRPLLLRARQRLRGCVRYVKTVNFVRFNIKMIILPRQARDKHRESAQTQTVFLQGRSSLPT
jgi:hypothetical protein